MSKVGFQRVGDFHYELPEQLIAQFPLPDRAASRMLVVDREHQTFFDDQFRCLPNYLRPGDCLVMNDTKVLPARLHGRRNRMDGAEVELFLLKEEQNPHIWKVLARPGKRVRVNDLVLLAPDFYAKVIGYGDRGERTVEFSSSSVTVEAALERAGTVPLPPYIHRAPDRADQSRYQTVFAEHRGSVAAPTAGLHFTPEILEACRKAGATTANITLHVGLGTFAPLSREQRLEEVKLHSENYRIPPQSLGVINQAARRVCVGTTSVRALESTLVSGEPSGMTSLFISPGYNFLGTGALLTNFHLPASSLLMLVCAFGGTELILESYRHAVKAGYRFFSYGDCMLVV